MMRRSQQGFTLLEILLVVAIFAIMAAMAYGGLNSVLKTRSSIEVSMKRTADLQKMYMRMRADFQNLAIRPIRDNYGDVQPALRGAHEAALELTRGGWRNPLFLRRSSMERVMYMLEDHQLIRASYRVLDRAQDSQPARITLLDRVKELRWRYMSTSNEWVEQWPVQSQASSSSSENQPDVPPPLAVEVTLETEDMGELRFLFKPGAEPLPANLQRQFNSGSSLPDGTEDGSNGNDDGGGNGSEVTPTDPDPPPTGDGEITQ